MVTHALQPLASFAPVEQTECAHDGGGGGAPQVSPQMLLTSLTHWLSQLVLQQYGSVAQIWLTHASATPPVVQPAVSFAPLAHLS